MAMDFSKNEIKNIDSHNMLELLRGFPAQCREGYNFSVPLPANKNFKNIIFCGMGGSAIGGDILKIFVDNHSSMPFSVIRDYKLPPFAGENTLLITTSYSGNTEETLSIYKEGIKRNCILWSISSNGQLEKLSKQNNTPYLKIPGGLPPRCALGYLFFPCYKMMNQLQIVPDIGEEIFTAIKKYVEDFSPHSENNKALNIAKKFYDKVPVIYSDNTLYPTILRWKTQIAENSKAFSFTNVFPEMNHNEIMSWHLPEWFVRNTIPVFVSSGEEFPRVKRREQITAEIIKNVQPDILRIKAKGTTLFEKILYLVILGDWVSYYLALYNKYDPTEIKEITSLKNELKKGESDE
jgi:glucose/mannose-6-phosphate isomerase